MKDALSVHSRLAGNGRHAGLSWRKKQREKDRGARRLWREPADLTVICKRNDRYDALSSA
jgi:hypothetical protein